MLHCKFETLLRDEQNSDLFVGGSRNVWSFLDDYGSPHPAFIGSSTSNTGLINTSSGDLFLHSCIGSTYMLEDLFSCDSVMTLEATFTKTYTKEQPHRVDSESVSVAVLGTNTITRDHFISTQKNDDGLIFCKFGLTFENFPFLICHSQLELACKIIDQKCVKVSEVVFIPSEDLDLLRQAEKSRTIQEQETGILGIVATKDSGAFIEKKFRQISSVIPTTVVYKKQKKQHTTAN
jgi:hypothetical protein